MQPAFPTRRSIGGVLLSAAIGACAGAVSPGAVSPGASTPGASSSAIATAGASASPSASVSAGSTPVTIPGCPTAVQAGALPSDQLVDVAFASGFGVDRITFTFGPAGPQPGGKPTGEVRSAEPPFSEGGSGQPVTIAGERFVSIIFRQMTIADEAGNEVFKGPDRLQPNASAVRELRLLDNFEGVVGWVAGIRGPGCVRVSRLTGPDRVIVEVQQP
jgi:hypothetical protein